ncbi:Uncharacterised protein [Neisseria dentiae]|nr:Uncharacterised protein [Neisseria dentiae]
MFFKILDNSHKSQKYVWGLGSKITKYNVSY